MNKTHNDWQANGDFPNQIYLSAFVRENVRLRSGAARAKAAQLEVVYTSISGGSHGNYSDYFILLRKWFILLEL